MLVWKSMNPSKDLEMFYLQELVNLPVTFESQE